MKRPRHLYGACEPCVGTEVALLRKLFSLCDASAPPDDARYPNLGIAP